MALDVEAIRARDSYLRHPDEWAKCVGCDLCSDCMTLKPCETHSDDDDVPALLDALEQVTAERDGWQERCVDLQERLDDALTEIDSLRAEAP